MKPSLPTVLNLVASLMREPSDGSEAGSPLELPLVLSTLATAGREYEQCASTRVTEIAGLSGLLGKGATLPGSPCSPPEPAGGLFDADLRISCLDARLDTLRAQLIELQSWLEQEPGEEAAALLREITAHLYETARRNAAILTSH
jgi:hypothetical protein